MKNLIIFMLLILSVYLGLKVYYPNFFDDEKLNNITIVEMTKKNIPDDVIISRINNSEEKTTDFKTDTYNIYLLQKNGVSNQVIELLKENKKEEEKRAYYIDWGVKIFSILFALYITYSSWTFYKSLTSHCPNI